MLIEMEESEH